MLPQTLDKVSFSSSFPTVFSSLSMPLTFNCHHLATPLNHHQYHSLSASLQQQRLWPSFKNNRKRLVCQFSQDGRSSVPSTQKDSSEELDEDELDALFEQHGEVVVEDPNPRPLSAEVDDDVQSLTLAVALAEAANDTKAVDIMVLHVKPLVYWTRFFVIATAFSRPQLSAINKKMRDVGEQKFNMLPRGDSKPNSWTLLDYGDVVVHIFLPKERAYYNLEEFYGNARMVELPFKSAATSSLE